MSETHWPEGASNLGLERDYLYAQTFSPLWSHNILKVRLYLPWPGMPFTLKISIQYLNPDGTPTGIDLTSVIIDEEHQAWGAFTPVRNRAVAPIRLVYGINYAFIVQVLHYFGTYKPRTLYMPPPSDYPRGKLIISSDGGDTWDTSDHGDLLFAEWGDPPLHPTPYTPPFNVWALNDFGQLHYRSNSCIRVGTTGPTTLNIHVTDDKPEPISTWHPRRGSSTFCLDHYIFENYRTYAQKEKDDSIYHTFLIGGLKEGQKYWYCFTGLSNFLPTNSDGPIIERTHPLGPPFSTIKRPDAPGDLCSWQLDGNGLPCPDHYQTINEASPDEEASELIGNTLNRRWRTDLYNLPDLQPFDYPIEQVHITGRFKNVGTRPQASVARSAIKTHGVIYEDSRTIGIGNTYENIHWHLYTNPFTNLPWTRAEVNNLQLGLKLRKTWGIGWTAIGHCTQLYCKIIADCSAYQ